MATEPPISRLPEELLLLIAVHLPDSGTPQHLKNLSLVSRKFRPAAQEALHAIAKLSLSCGCHPKVNAAVKLLRTLLDRPDLASKVRVLRFRTVRKNIAKFYESQGFDLSSLRDCSLSRLQELDYGKSHPWWRSIENAIESAFAGLLLVQLPNLVHLDFWVKDHHRGPPSSECITGLFGSSCPPATLAHVWKGIKHLTLGDTHMLKCGLEFPSLTSLDLKTISIGTVLRLNGPGCLQGTDQLRKLALTCSIQFADRPLVEKADVQLSDVFDALGCRQLCDLKILLINDGYHIGDDLLTQLDAGYFMDQLCKVQDTLESLAITFEPADDETELEWLLDMCTHPKESLRHFAALKRLIIPQVFVFAVTSVTFAHPGITCQPKDLPEKLESLEMLYPHEDIEKWVAGFLNFQKGDDRELPNLKEIVLTCRDEVGIPSAYFTKEVDRIWWKLSIDYGIESFVVCQVEGTRVELVELYHDYGSETDGEDGDDWADEGSDDDDDMPDLIDPMD
ncbi:hypothetical protein T440DRAFT_486886 [Plenodomus tracheiphilus IPT5]|uniref:F-box domain-containing protein n=1 Tax=Plenodomus tracheiphilus IPT5 TaxID=1408161 RepID=A0A6A7BFX8_9PLEO|nr:hypothetical protein T440DRAFT_486886 [Plenodomus tracheiphilus IPT5]